MGANLAAQPLAVGDQMFLGMQDFDFAQILIICAQILPILTKFYPNLNKFAQIFSKKYLLGDAAASPAPTPLAQPTLIKQGAKLAVLRHTRRTNLASSRIIQSTNLTALRLIGPEPTHQCCSCGEPLATCGKIDRLGI